MFGNTLEYIPGLANVYSPALFINDNNWIVGHHFGPSNRIVPYVYTGEEVLPIDSFGAGVGEAFVAGITNTNLVYGTAQDLGYNYSYHYTWTPDGGVVRLFGDRPWRYNDLGDWVGEKNGYARDVFVSNGQVHMFGEDFGVTGVNNSRQVLLDGYWSQVDALWENGTYTRLIDLIAPQSEYYKVSGWKLYEDGSILGRGLYNGNLYRQILLTPVPEPATCLVLASGAYALLRKARKGARA